MSIEERLLQRGDMFNDAVQRDMPHRSHTPGGPGVGSSMKVGQGLRIRAVLEWSACQECGYLRGHDGGGLFGGGGQVWRHDDVGGRQQA
ncbi:hypothetical protein [Streptomyces umbrinus]|uniref:hypothetical protein n=1 Tax=Streptomyces umbrinus TaxID=67370 RepID=UPI0033DFA0B8